MNEEARIIEQADAAAVKGLEERKVVVDRAARVLEAFETEGGKIMLEEFEKLRKTWDFSPEELFRMDANGNQYLDASFAARCAGAREGIHAIFSWKRSLEILINEEAAKANEKSA